MVFSLNCAAKSSRFFFCPIRHTLRLYFTQHIHTLITGIFAVIEILAKYGAATAVCRSAEAARYEIKLPVGSPVFRLENSGVDSDDLAVDVIFVVVGDTVRFGNNRRGNTQLLNL